MSPHPLRDRSRELRRNGTKQEKQLWYQFLSTFPYRVHRQRVIGNYIVDFYCHKARLVIEVDGGQHDSEEIFVRDEARTAVLRAHGLMVIRFTNWEVENEFLEVCKRIRVVADERVGDVGKDHPPTPL